jgi:hypothetical protein
MRAIGVEPTAGEDEQSEAAILRRNTERCAAAEALATGAETAPAGGEDSASQDTPASEAGAAHGAPVAPDEGDRAEDTALLDAALAAPGRPAKTSLRDAAAAVLAAWDGEANGEADMITALDAPMQALRAALAGKPPRARASPARPARHASRARARSRRRCATPTPPHLCRREARFSAAFSVAGRSSKSPGSENAAPERGLSRLRCASEPTTPRAKTAENLRLTAPARLRERV